MDGLNTIQTVGFTSYHVEGDSMLASGNLIEMYDDGSEVNLLISTRELFSRVFSVRLISDLVFSIMASN